MRAEDREFLPAALEIYETPPSPIAVSFIWIICVLFVAALLRSSCAWAAVVTTTDDSGPGSLREAIANATPGETVSYEGPRRTFEVEVVSVRPAD